MYRYRCETCEHVFRSHLSDPSELAPEGCPECGGLEVEQLTDVGMSFTPYDLELFATEGW